VVSRLSFSSDVRALAASDLLATGAAAASDLLATGAAAASDSMHAASAALAMPKSA